MSELEILKWLDNKYVDNYKVLDFRNKTQSIYLRLKISFIDKSTLHVKEYISINKRSYSYHWQNKNNEMLIRWDNAPHYKNISTFPHHKHIMKDKISKSNAVTLKEVLKYIINTFT